MNHIHEMNNLLFFGISLTAQVAAGPRFLGSWESQGILKNYDI